MAKRAKKRRKGPSRKQLAARKRFGDMARKRAKAARKAVSKEGKSKPAHRRAANSARRTKRHAAHSGGLVGTKRKKGARRGAVAKRAHGRKRSGHGLVVHRSRRRIAHRNPMGALSVSGAQATLIRGVKDAGALIAGEAMTNIIANAIPFGGNSVPVTIAKKALSALVVGYVASHASNADAARFAVAGGLATVLRGAVKQIAPPMIANSLGDDFIGNIGEYVSGFGAYPIAPHVVAAALPNPNGVGDDVYGGGVSRQFVGVHGDESTL